MAPRANGSARCPHSPLEALAPDIWTACGAFPSSQLPRTMVVHRYGGDSLLLHSVVALDERTMRHLEALARRGDVAIITTSHGDALTTDLAAVVAEVARFLG